MEFDLTPRQWEILRLMCEGIGPAEIARRLGSKKQSVRNAWEDIQQKTGYSYIGPLCLKLKQEGLLVSK